MNILLLHFNLLPICSFIQLLLNSILIKYVIYYFIKIGDYLK